MNDLFLTIQVTSNTLQKLDALVEKRGPPASRQSVCREALEVLFKGLPPDREGLIGYLESLLTDKEIPVDPDEAQLELGRVRRAFSERGYIRQKSNLADEIDQLIVDLRSAEHREAMALIELEKRGL